MCVNQPIRVLLIGNHSVVCEGLTLLIERNSEMTVAAQATNSMEAIELYRRHRPQVTLMDLNLESVETIVAIRGEFPDANILILAIHEREEDINRGIEAGAKGFLFMKATEEQLLEAIRTVYSGHPY